MTSCPACNTETQGWARFCRNCGAALQVSVTEMDDTRRFDPHAPRPTGPLSNPNASLYAPPQSVYPTAQPLTPPYKPSLLKTLFGRKFVWLTVFVILFFAFSVAGITISRNRRIHNRIASGENVRRAPDKSIQNALGVMASRLSEAGYEDIRGVFVNQLVSDDGPAAQAKIEAGDVITELNGQPVSDARDLDRILNSLKSGTEVPVKVHRDGETISAQIKVGDPAVAPWLEPVDPRDQGFLGIGETTRRCCVPGTKRRGVEIERVNDNGPADLFGLRPGDVIVEVDGHAVRTPNELARRIKAVKPRNKVQITFYRGSTEQKIEMMVGHVGPNRFTED